MEKGLKTFSMSIRAGQDELEKRKMAARIEAYASYDEFVRRTALMEASQIPRSKLTGHQSCYAAERKVSFGHLGIWSTFHFGLRWTSATGA